MSRVLISLDPSKASHTMRRSCELLCSRIGRAALSGVSGATGAATCLQAAVQPCGTYPTLPAAALGLAKQLHISGAWCAGRPAGGIPELGGTPARKLTVYQIDAFTATPFAGNPAAVVLLPPGAALSDELRAQIGAEVSNSMTAFLEPLSDDGEPCAGGRDSSEFASGRQYRIRWFASTDGEYRICGHATIASAAALLQGEGNTAETLLFDSVHSGQLAVRRLTAGPQPLLQLDLPLLPPEDPLPAGLDADHVIDLLVGDALVAEVAFHAGLGYLLIRLAGGGEKRLEALQPDIVRLRELQAANPEGDRFSDYDYLSRFWAPLTLANEDPATGSTHAVAAPFWAARLGKRAMTTRQCSARGGEAAVLVDHDAGLVRVSARAAIVMSGLLHLPA